jgi:hypothetical protein
MILLLVLLDAAVALVVILVTCVQVLYLEALRLRAREMPALEFFKDSIEPRIGLDTELGSLTFSLVKHLGLVAVGCLTLAITEQTAPAAEALAAACVLAGVYTVVGVYIVPQMFYRKSSGRGLVPLIPFFRATALVVRPLTWGLGFLQSLFELGEQPEPGNEPTP